MIKSGGTYNKVSACINDERGVTLHFGAGGLIVLASLVKFARAVELYDIVFIMDWYRVA